MTADAVGEQLGKSLGIANLKLTVEGGVRPLGGVAQARDAGSLEALQGRRGGIERCRVAKPGGQPIPIDGFARSFGSDHGGRARRAIDDFGAAIGVRPQRFDEEGIELGTLLVGGAGLARVRQPGLDAHDWTDADVKAETAACRPGTGHLALGNGVECQHSGDLGRCRLGGDC